MTDQTTPVTMPKTPIDSHRYDYKNPDFDVQAVVGDLPTRRSRAIKTFIYTTAGTLGLTAAMFMSVDFLNGESLSDHRNDIAEAEVAVDEAEDAVLAEDYREQQQQVADEERYDDLVVSLGEGCVALFQPYVDGEVLGDVAEDGMVNDVIGTPGQACGDRPTEIRRSFREFEVAYQDVQNETNVGTAEVFDADGTNDGAQEELDRELRHLAEIQSQTADVERDHHDAQWPNALWPGALAAVAIGLGAAAGSRIGVPYSRYELAQARLATAIYHRGFTVSISREIDWHTANELANEIAKRHVPDAKKRPIYYD